LPVRDVRVGQFFTREFGELRTFGLARRTRENPDLRPVSPVEMLWYCGLIGRAFLKITGEPQEYVYIPDEFLNMSSLPISEKNPLIPRPATTAESKVQILASDSILDDATELLAALRMNRPLENIFPASESSLYPILVGVALSDGIDYCKPSSGAGKSKKHSSPLTAGKHC